MIKGKIWIKTLNKFLALCSLAIDEDRVLTVQEIVATINCCESHAYNYLRALDKLRSLVVS